MKSVAFVLLVAPTVFSAPAINSGSDLNSRSRRVYLGDETFEEVSSETDAIDTSFSSYEASLSCGFGRDKSGELYTCLEGSDQFAKVSEDMLTWSYWPSTGDVKFDEETRRLITFTHDTTEYLAVVQPEKGRVLLVDISAGTISYEITAPSNSAFTAGSAKTDANDHYDNAGDFKPTGFAADGDYIFVSTGLTAPDADFVLRAKYDSVNDEWNWDTAWGGDGTANGEFKGASDLIWHDGSLGVANQGNKRVDYFEDDGTFEESQDTPNDAKVEYMDKVPGTALGSDKLLLHDDQNSYLVSIKDQNSGWNGLKFDAVSEVPPIPHGQPHEYNGDAYIVGYGDDAGDSKYGVYKHDPTP